VRKLFAAGIVAALLGFGAEPSHEIKNDTILRAMLDEVTRSKTLQLNNLDKPYFIEYTVSDAEQSLITASLGGLTSSTRLHVRQPRLRVRVGDYKFDNANSIYSQTPRLGLFPIDDDYHAMRAELWLTTDVLYKGSTDQITRKRTALREIGDPDKTADLAPAKAVQILEPLSKLKLDQKHWEQVVRQLSGRFAAHPEIVNSSVRLRAIASDYRLVNSEGTVVRTPQDLSEIDIVANGLASDGSRVWNHELITALNLSELPKEDELAKRAEKVAAETEALIKAPVAEDYSGPVLFDQEAAAQMMAQVLADTIRLQRKPLAPPGTNNPGAQMIESVWSSRIGAKVMPDWMTIVDDPREERINGTALAGHYDVDDEGVPAEKVTIVEKGVLKGFLFSRQPIRDFAASNGHGRLPGGWGSQAAVIGSLFVQADQTISEAQLRAKLMEKVKAAGLKYGIIIRRLDFPSTANFQELQSLARQLQKSGFARTLNTPLLVYRAYPDGHEELVRNVRFREFSARDLRDVNAASDHPYVLNYVNNGSSFNLTNMDSDATSSSLVCPSLLFDSIDLARAEDEPGRLPIVPPPALIAQQ
jgi:TldD protein